jgi:hypothetical protein
MSPRTPEGDPGAKDQQVGFPDLVAGSSLRFGRDDTGHTPSTLTSLAELHASRICLSP